MKKLFLLIVLISFYSCDRNKLSDDEKAIIATIHYLEETNFLNGITFPRLGPPPPLPPPGFVHDSIDFESRIKNETSYRERIKKFYVRRLNTPIVDSSFIFLSVYDSLISNYSWVHLNKNDFENYEILLNILKSNKEENITFNTDAINAKLQKKYRIKPISEFPDKEDLFGRMYSFLYGGDITFSRFYHNDKYGIILFGHRQAQRDSNEGQLVLFEKVNGRWEIKEMHQQWVS